MSKENSNNAKEPFSNYGKRIKVYSSFEEEEQSKLVHAASLTHLECLNDLRKYINRSYGITNENLPQTHSITIVSYK